MNTDPAMCPDCDCCHAGSCTTTGRWMGYCTAACPCELVDNLVDDGIDTDEDEDADEDTLW